MTIGVALKQNLLSAVGSFGPPGEADAAVDGECAAGHIGGVVAQGVGDPFGDFVRTAEPAEGE